MTLDSLPLDPEPWEVAEDNSRHPYEAIHPACADSDHLLCQLALWRPRAGYERDESRYREGAGK